MCENIEEMAEQYAEFIVKYSDFQIQKSIGEGGFAEVYLANYIPFNQLCAVKKLKAKDLTGDKFRLYYREIDILSRLSNPFLIGFIGFSVQKPYIVVTEYISNGSLYDALRWKDDRKPLTGTQKTLIAMGIASGMERLHKLHIIHRDLKSLNILLDKDLLPKIIDFGLSRNEGEKNELMTINVGTPHWMAPELFMSLPYTNKIDVYAYGMLLWEILTNSSPFKNKTAAQIMYDVCQKGSRPAIPMRTPTALKTMISKCWAQDPNERPTFHQIFKAFSQGMVLFDGANQEEIIRFANKIKMETKYKSKRTNKITKKKKPIKKAQTDVKNINMDLIYDVDNPDFDKSFEKVVNELQPSNSDDFFGAISQHISPKTPKNNLILILESIEKLFAQDTAFYKSFIDKKIYSKLTFYIPECTDSLLNILLYFFTNSPQLITNEHISLLSQFTLTRPKNVLRLINILTTNNVFVSNNPDGFWMLCDILFSKRSDFTESNCGVDLLRVVYTLYKTSYSFQKQKKQDFIMLLQTMLAKRNDDAEKAIDVICNEPSIKFYVSDDVLIPLIQDMKLSSRALVALSKLNIEPSGPLLDTILNACRSSPLATLILCERCMIPHVAFSVSVSGAKWLGVGLPDLDHTLKLLMVILMHKEARDALPVEVAQTLINVINSNGKLFDSLSPLIMKMTITKPLLQILSQSFLEKFYNIAFQKGADGIASALSVTDKLARCGFCEGYTLLIPYLKKMFESPDWQPYALSTIAELSVFPEMKIHFVNHGFLDDIKTIKDQKQQFVQICLQNLS